MNVVKQITPELKRLAEPHEPIRSQESKKAEQKRIIRILSVHAPKQTKAAIDKTKAVDNQLLTMAEVNDLSSSKISAVYAKTNAEYDRVI